METLRLIAQLWMQLRFTILDFGLVAVLSIEPRSLLSFQHLEAGELELVNI